MRKKLRKGLKTLACVFVLLLSSCAWNIRTPQGDFKCYSNHDLSSEVDFDCYAAKIK